MKPRDFLNFFKTKTGKLITFGSLFALALIIFGTLRKQHTPESVPVVPLATNSVSAKPEVVQTVIRPMQPYHPPPPPKSQTTSSSSARSASPELQPALFARARRKVLIAFIAGK